ncbi:uncharacterized protein N7529_000675 [Penicillium soppii]|uniref:uncharacterized protein n=1 Tax=Penicillium soppii TaxID=69789 RepID=UPI002549530C|nr:uncharacterized protein N7529_000675 [Penicillium soppii]KAJ5882003.1 hypothetical protein N7529_000675 [Penicillium soppii]
MERRTVLITGCSHGGIGSALAEAFHQRGFHVFATARKTEKMKHLSYLARMTLIPLDVTQESQIIAALELVQKHTGGTLDYLVNNAGDGYIIPVLDCDQVHGRQIFDVNFWGPLRMIQEFSPLLIAARGTIVNINSVASETLPLWLGIYSSSKAALLALSETLRLELKPFGVQVLSVMTGAVQTMIFQENYRLPPDSAYVAWEKQIAAQAEGSEQASRMSAPVYAERVVGDILNRRGGITYRGQMASFAYWVVALMPRFLRDLVTVKMAGIS